jgi:hypothetical protein
MATEGYFYTVQPSDENNQAWMDALEALAATMVNEALNNFSVDDIEDVPNG